MPAASLKGGLPRQSNRPTGPAAAAAMEAADTPPTANAAVENVNQPEPAAHTATTIADEKQEKKKRKKEKKLKKKERERQTAAASARKLDSPLPIPTKSPRSPSRTLSPRRRPLTPPSPHQRRQPLTPPSPDRRSATRVQSRSRSRRGRSDSRDSRRSCYRPASSDSNDWATQPYQNDHQWPPSYQGATVRQEEQARVQRWNLECEIGKRIQCTGRQANDMNALKAHQRNSSRCLSLAGRGPKKQRCPWGCGKLLAASDSWAQQQHGWHCPNKRRRYHSYG